METEFGPRTPGNPYSSNATYEVAVVLASNRRCWDLIEAKGARRADGTVDAQRLRDLFARKLRQYGIPSLPAGQVDWEDVADEFKVESPSIESPSIDACEDSDEPGQGALAGSRAIEPDLLSLLRSARLADSALVLPAQRLDKAVYARLDAVLRALGGKWDRGSQSHLFAPGDMSSLEAAIVTGRFIDPKDFGFFPTPPEIARRVIEAADLREGDMVLEPSAGHGSLADMAAALVGPQNVHVAEMLPRNRAVLQAKGYEILGEDFLAIAPEPIYDRIVMNPPFGNMADVDHVRHAAQFLSPGGRLVAIMSPSFEFRSSSKAKDFRDLLLAAAGRVEDLPDGSFKQSGTNVRTVLVTVDVPHTHRERHRS